MTGERLITPISNTEEEIDPKQAVINTLSSNNIDYLDITDDDMNKLVDNFDEEVINSNITTIGNQGIDTDMLIDNISLFYDSELKDMEGRLNLIRGILSKYDNSLNALKAIGYKELIDVVNGRDSLEHAVELIKQHTRNYAKRQMTFIRHQFPVEFYKDNQDLWRILNE